jgi:hypothetical protein
MHIGDVKKEGQEKHMSEAKNDMEMPNIIYIGRLLNGVSLSLLISLAMKRLYPSLSSDDQ